MLKFKRGLFLLFAISALVLSSGSCSNEEPPISIQSNLGLFTTWTLVREEAECSEGSTYPVRNTDQTVTIKFIRDLTYEYSIDGQLVQEGQFIAFSGSETISFVPPIHSNNITDFSQFEFPGGNVIITTTEFLSPGSIETCEVRRVYGRR